MQKADDWKDLGSVMAHYSVSLSSDIETMAEYNKKKKAWEAWEPLWETIREKCTAVALLDDFLQEHGDCAIEINGGTRKNLEGIAVKGTGSPNKLLQMPRGSLSVD